jgi:hypothetical protein
MSLQAIVWVCAAVGCDPAEANEAREEADAVDVAEVDDLADEARPATSAWVSLGGKVNDPAASTYQDGRLTVFGRGTDGAVWQIWQTSVVEEGWSGWVSLGGSTTSGVSVAPEKDGRLVVLVRGLDGALWALEQAADRVTRREPLITAGSVDYASQRLYFDNRKAREELGFTVRPLDETLRRAAAWFAANGYL